MSNNNDTAGTLTQQHCKPCTSATDSLNPNQIDEFLKQIKGWSQLDSGIEKTFPFDSYPQVILFANAVAWLSNRENHHPDLTLSYNKCRVVFTTHAINGLSTNDFICAAKVDALLTA